MVLSLVERFVKGSLSYDRMEEKVFTLAKSICSLAVVRLIVWSDILLIFQPITAQLCNLNFLACPVISWKMNRSFGIFVERLYDGETERLVGGFTYLIQFVFTNLKCRFMGRKNSQKHFFSYLSSFVWSLSSLLLIHVFMLYNAYFKHHSL